MNSWNRCLVLLMYLTASTFSTASYSQEAIDQIIAFDDEEIEVRIGEEIDYWPTDKLGTPPINILERDDSNFARINSKTSIPIWVSLSYVTTSSQKAMTKNCQARRISENESKRQFSARGVGESCTSED